jgi:hypothetical protein
LVSCLCALALALCGAAWPGPTAGAKGNSRNGVRHRVLAPVTYKNLTLFPISYTGVSAEAGSNYITLDEGIKSGTVVITERGAQETAGHGRRGNRRVSLRTSGDATVNQLALVNKSGKKLLLLAGEVIVGGKQDRIVEEDLIVPPVSVPISLNVFCVELGRWSHRAVSHAGGGGARPTQQARRAEHAPTEAPAPAQNFSALGAISHPKLRAAAQDRKNQDEVWKEVRENNTKLGTQNSTETYQEVYSNPEVEARVEDYVAELEKAGAGANVVGVVVARNGEFVWVDAFGSRSLFARYWPKLLKSYVVDALGDRTSERVPTVAQAEQYFRQREGASSVSGREGVYRLTKTSAKHYAVFSLEDLSLVRPMALHFNKMQKE